MRVTNNMMINNTVRNINGNKANQSYLNNQMTTQKKIQRPSENPVIAIRALRLRSSLSQINQYYEKNIPDVEAWFKAADTAIYNMNKIIKDCYVNCVNGRNDPYNPDNRKSILESLTALKTQLYSEGNGDNAGRTIFTGYRTSSQLTFMDAEKAQKESYDITQSFTYKDISEYKYYSGNVEVPQTLDEILAGVENGSDPTKAPYISDTDETVYDRIRLAYDDITSVASISYTYNDATTTFENGTQKKTAYATYKNAAKETISGSFEVNADNKILDAGGNVIQDGDGNDVTVNSENVVTSTVVNSTPAGTTLTIYDTEADWQLAKGIKEVGADEMVFIKNSGDLILGKNVSNTLKSGRADIQVDYEKTGFSEGELRPEYYYNCVCKTDPDHPVTHEKFDADGNKQYEDIHFNIAVNQSIAVNLHADELFDMSIYQDTVELINAVEKAITASEKVEKLENMQKEAKYVDYQDEIQKWLDAAKKEADYAGENLGNLFEQGVGNYQAYMDKINVGYTEIGARGQQLEMTKNRLDNQKLTVEELKSTNENRELSDIIIDYTAAYNAYQASLMAASKVEKQTLLNYI